jgi:hypothetical protein
MTHQQLAMLVALAGLGCIVWSVVQRYRGVDARGGKGESRADNPQTPLWWAGMVLTVVALIILRMGG